jgi:hypothetical protein
MKKFKSQLFQRTNSSLLAVGLLVASSCGVSPVQLIPQDIDFASSNLPTHDGNAVAFSEESSRLPLQSTELKKSTLGFSTA